jgi:hypothetical protein
MPLTGEAKAAYQREYMKQRRAGSRPATKRAAASHVSELEAALDRERKARRDLAAELAGERRARMAAEARAEMAWASRPKPASPQMSTKVRNSVIKALHPDHATHSTKASREEVLKMFMQEMH